MIIQTGRAGEEALRELGLEIPEYPKTGEVKLNGRRVGYADNFNGISIEDDEPIIKNIVACDGQGFVCWNIPAY